MEFPAGRTILLIAVFAVIGLVGRAIILPSQRTADQTVWTFDPSHLATYTDSSGAQASLVEIHREQTGKRVEVQLMPSRALDARLISLILSGTSGREVPDVVEIEIGSVGKYFRAPPDKNGLLPLEGYITTDPAAWNLLPSRLASWTNSGHVFGIARDVHPVTLSYREDLFRQAGVDVSNCTTWEQFREACLKYQRYWRDKGIERWAMQLSRWSASDLMIMVQQQRIRLLDYRGRPELTEVRLARTIAQYAQMVSGPQRISAPVPSNVSARDLAEGHTAALFTPDWGIEYLRWDPDLLGRLRMMPLPRFDEGDARTASWGGTMVSIPRNCADPDAAWRLLRDLQLTPAALYARQYHSSIIPAVTTAWENKTWDRPDPLFGGQAIGRLYIDLARELPQQRVSPYMPLISQLVASVLSDAQSRLETKDKEGLEEYCALRLAEAQAQAMKLLDFAGDRP